MPGTDQPAAETGGQAKLFLIVAGVAAVLVAAVLGLTIGNGAAPEEADPTLTVQETFVEARKNALAEVKLETAKEGFRAGRKEGATHGRQSGKRAGQSDGALQAQLQIASDAEAAAASAQAELGAISAPPPAVPVPAVPVEPAAPPAD